MHLEDKNRVEWMNWLNILACIMVIGIHCNLQFNNYEFSNKWFLSSILNACYYWANGCFVMLSGANLIDYRERYSTHVFVEKRCKRVVIPFIIWSVVAVVIRTIWGELRFDNGIMSSIKMLVNMGINNGCMFGGVFWFFYMIIILYLTIPFFSMIPKNNRKNIYGALIIFAFILNSFLPVVFSQYLGIPWNDDLTYPIMKGMVIYLLLGYWLKNYDLSKKARVYLRIGGGIAWICLAFGTIFVCSRSNSFWGGFCGWSNWPAVLICANVFDIFKNSKNISIVEEKYAKYVGNISNCSLGVYCIHMIVINIFLRYLKISSESYSWMLMAPIGIYLISVVIVLLMKKIPVLGKILFP